MGFAPVIEAVPSVLEFLDRWPRNCVGHNQAVNVTNIDRTAFEVEIGVPSRQTFDQLQIDTLVVLIAQRRQRRVLELRVVLPVAVVFDPAPRALEVA